MASESPAQRAARAAIAAMQEKEGLSQDGIAKRLSTSQATVSRLARGETERPKEHLMSSLAEYVPGELLEELNATNEKLPRDRVAELEQRVAALEATIAKLTGG